MSWIYEVLRLCFSLSLLVKRLCMLICCSVRVSCDEAYFKPVILQIFQTLRGPPFFIPDSIGHLYVSCTWAWDLSTGPLMPPMLKAKLVFSCTCCYLFVWSWIFGNNVHLLSTRLEWCFSFSRVQLVIENTITFYIYSSRICLVSVFVDIY